MAGIDEVLERLVTDEAFRAQLAADPQAALAGYDLDDEDRAMLVSQVSNDPGRAGTLEGRTSKAGLFGLLGGLDDIADAVSAGADDRPEAADLAGAGGGGPASDTGENAIVGAVAGVPEVSSDQYDYPGDYASRGGDPELQAKGDYQGDPVNRYHLEQAWPKAEADGHEAAHTVQQDAPTPADADEQITIHGPYDHGSHSPADPGGDSTPTYQNTFEAIPDGPHTPQPDEVLGPQAGPAAGPARGGEIEVESFAWSQPSTGQGGSDGDDLLVAGRTTSDAEPVETVDADESITIHAARTEGTPLDGVPDTVAGTAPDDDAAAAYHQAELKKVMVSGWNVDSSSAPAAGVPYAGDQPGVGDLASGAGPSQPATYGDAGEQTYLAVKLENVQGAADPAIDMTAEPSADSDQPNESDLDFVEQRADADGGADVAVEELTLAHESIELVRDEAGSGLSTDDAAGLEPDAASPAELAADAQPEKVMGSMHTSEGTHDAAHEQPSASDGVTTRDNGDESAAATFHDGWIELNSITQTVTRAAQPELPDLEAASAPGGAAGSEDSPGLWQINADAGPTTGQGVNEVSMDDSAGRETGEHEIEMSVEPGETPPSTEPDQVATPQPGDTPTAGGDISPWTVTHGATAPSAEPEPLPGAMETPSEDGDATGGGGTTSVDDWEESASPPASEPQPDAVQAVDSGGGEDNRGQAAGEPTTSPDA